MINSEATKKKFGYYPSNLAANSRSLIVIVCDYCQNNFDVPNRRPQLNGCRKCRVVHNQYIKENSKIDKHEFWKTNQNLLVVNLPDFVLVEETIEKFGYDPRFFTKASRKPVIIKCVYCSDKLESNLHSIFFSGAKNCDKCIRFSQWKRSGLSKDEYVKLNRVYSGSFRVDVEESKKKFGHLELDVNTKTHRKVVARCEFCEENFETTLISLHHDSKCICCFPCSSIATQYFKTHSNLPKHEYYLCHIKKRQESKIAKSHGILEYGSEKFVDFTCEFCKRNIKKAVKYAYNKSGFIACKKCARSAAFFIKNKNDKTPHEFWLQERSRISLKYVDIEATKEKFGYDPSDFTRGSHSKIIVNCYFCGEKTETHFNYFVKRKCKKTCKKCKHKRNVETIQEKYGVSTVLDIPGVQEKLNNPLPERIVEALLRDKYKIDFIRRFMMPIVDGRYYEFDFLIPSLKLLIECQGDWVHDFKKNGYSGLPKDRSKTTYIELHTDYKLLHIWEHEIHLGRLSKILNYHIYNILEPKIKIDSLKSIVFRKISDRDAHVFLSSYHYLGNLGSVASCYGGYYGDVLICVAVFGGTTRQTTFKKVNVAMNRSFGHKQLKELRRFCIRPNVEAKRMASFCIREFVKIYRRDFPITEAVISFADPTVGDSGSIYNYAGWKQLADTSQSYHYMDLQTLKILHKKTIWDRAGQAHMKEADFALSIGLVKVSECSKHMWIRLL